MAQGGERIDRSRPLEFRFEGQRYRGVAGDTLASALLANGVRVLARSFKFHRPRGVLSCGIEEPNGLIQVGTGAGTLPVVRATQLELAASLDARAVRGWPSLRFDVGRVLDWTAPLWPAGFYNKTFIWPGWRTYEHFIRRMAGFGSAPPGADLSRYEVRNLHCEVLVVGGGVAGLSAALTHARSGARVVLVEQDTCLGGHAPSASSTAEHRVDERIDDLKKAPQVILMTRTTAVGVYDHRVVACLERLPAAPGRPAAPRERYWIIRTQRIVLATGAIEQPLIFDNNDRPGIMLASAVDQYLKRYAVVPGRRVLIATNNDSAYAVAQALNDAGVGLAGVLDSRTRIPAPLLERMRSMGVPVIGQAVPVDAHGGRSLRAVTVGELSEDATRVVTRHRVACDVLAVSGGFSPTLQLLAHAGGRLAFDSASGVLQPTATHRGIDVTGFAAERIPIGPRLSPIGNPARQWVDLLHDVTVADLELALRENYTAVEHVKRYTTVGMAADQGKTATAATLQILAQRRGIEALLLGHSTMRPPFTPVTLGAIVGAERGALFAPKRLLPLHAWHVAHGGLMQDFGTWQRPVAYPLTDESRQQAARREARAVRSGAALLDGSSLGKIEVQGPDALEFLDRFYINNLATLTPGRARYGIMLRESGIIFDDGTVTLLAPDHALITTTSGNATRVAAWLEEWHQCEWPSLRIVITPVTEGWATLSLAGPKARRILLRLSSSFDCSSSAFPHLAVRTGMLCDVPARIYRVSFTGELTYEINVPTGAAADIWERLMRAGEPEGLLPLGMDALLQLRLEKGFLHIGTDTDGTTVPDDVGWGKPALAKTRDYIGKRSLLLPEHIKADRLQLVGLTSPKESTELIVGSHIRLPSSQRATDGWITSAGRDTLTGAPRALALVYQGRAQTGVEVSVHDAGRTTSAKIVAPAFYDPQGERLHV